MKPVIHALLDGLIDYAGLFPPSALAMESAVQNYSRYLESPESFALGRFVVPVARLEELAREQARVPHSEEWRLSALIGVDAAHEIGQIDRFNSQHSGRTVIDMIEMKVTAGLDLAETSALVGDEVDLYFELLPDDGRSLLSEVAACGRRAKIRTGGITEEAFPSAASITQFISGCKELNLPFKATAGLHHPLRCVKPFTYEPSSPSGTMHGFVNLFVTAALIDHGEEVAKVEPLLEETEREAFEVTDDAIVWRGLRITSAQMRETRERFALSFGSCSFEEPFSDLRELGWL